MSSNLYSSMTSFSMSDSFNRMYLYQDIGMHR